MSDDSAQMRQRNTASGRHPHKRIIHKREMDTIATIGEHHDSHHI